jgi:membrane dipeptidase
MPTFDGLIFSGDGWNAALEESGLSALHVTAADFFGDFEQTCAGIADWHRTLERDAERLFLVRDAEGLARIGSDERIGVVLGLQNAAALGTDLRRVEVLWRLDVRVLQLTYNEANQLADGCIEERDAGLSRLGRDVVRECGRAGILVDLSHVGRQSCLDAVAVAEQPVAITHANPVSVTPSPRNKDDDVLRAVAATGGVIGASPYGPMCWDRENPPTAATFVRTIHALLELVGEDHVAVGTDFSAMSAGAGVEAILRRSLDLYPEIFGSYVEAYGNGLAARYCRDLPTVASWPQIPRLLLESGLSAETTAKVVGGNWIRLLGQVWGAQS